MIKDDAAHVVRWQLLIPYLVRRLLEKQFHGESISLRSSGPDPEGFGPPGSVIICMDPDPDTPITSKKLRKTLISAVL